MAAPARRLATLDDLLEAEREGVACEIVDGELVQKAMSDHEHGGVKFVISGYLADPFNRRGGGGRPGGWWLANEVDIAFDAENVLRPDVAGWRRDRVAVMPREWPTTVTPDWVCEVLSASTARRDLGTKRDTYHRARVGHYWVVDRNSRVLLVYRWTEVGYALVLTGGETDTVHAEPFGAVGIYVGRLFGLDEPDEAPG